VTALPGRRRRSTLIAAGAAVAAVALAVALGVLGAVTLYNSTEGADASSGRPEMVFPATPTGLLAAVDDSGQLASMAVLVVQPGGRGGSIIPVPVSADASGGKGDERLPVAETFSLAGVDSLPAEAESLLGVSLDVVEVVDAERLTEILEPFGPLEVDLPADVTDADGDTVADAGSQTLDPSEAAAVLTARDPEVPALEQYPAAEAVWSAVATAIGDGGVRSGTSAPAATEPTDPSASAADGSLDAILVDLAAGPVGARGLRSRPPNEGTNPRRADVVLLDPAELALVFGQIAPGKMAAPNPALSVRIEATFSDEELEESGMTNSDVAFAAVSQILFVGGNVLSVDTVPADEPSDDVTVIDVADETLIAGTDGADVLFGPIDVRVGDTRIAGVDATIRLGTDYLDLLAELGAAPMPTVPTTEPGAGDG
jgi:hypothetical protein